MDGKVQSTLIYYGDGVRTREYTRRELLIYPDYFDGWFSETYHSDVFWDYMERNNQLTNVFVTGTDLQSIHLWIVKAHFVFVWPPPGTRDNMFELSVDVMKRVLSFVDQHPSGREFDKNLLYLIVANRLFEEGDQAGAMEYFKKFDQQNIARSADRYEYIEKTFFLNMMKQLCINLAVTGSLDEAVNLAEKFTKEEEKAFVYTFMADEVFRKNADPDAFIYLDSAFSKNSLIF